VGDVDARVIDWLHVVPATGVVRVCCCVSRRITVIKMFRLHRSASVHTDFRLSTKPSF
jgi:hypothetical protein